MGLTESKRAGDDLFTVDPVFTGAYDEVMKECTGSADSRTGGGCGSCILGGAAHGMDLADVSEYVDSINSKAKTRIIDAIIDAAAKIGLKPEGKDRASKIVSLISHIPAPEKWKKGDADQQRVITGIAAGINNAYGRKVVNETLPGDALCQHIIELLHSLTASVHTEFLSVYADVQKVIHNLKLLEEQQKANQAQLEDKIRTAEDPSLIPRLQANYDLGKILLDEVARQTQILSNLLNIQLIPAASDLSALLKSKEDIHGFIKKIDFKPGSDKFGRVITDLLKGMGLTANIMLTIQKALDTTGLTLAEYKAMKNLDQLRAAVVSKAPISDDELHKFNLALKMLEENLSRVKYTDNIVGGEDGRGLVSDPSMEVSGEYQPLYIGSAEYPASRMDKRVSDRKKLRNLIYSTFARQLHEILDKVVGAIDVLSMKIGTEIPVTDQLDGFRQALSRINLDLSRKQQVHLALIGYYNDAMSKSKRDNIVGELKMLGSFIDTILEMPTYRSSAGYFQAVKVQTEALLALIGKYAEEITAKFGRGEESELDSDRKDPDRNGGGLMAALPGGSAVTIGGASLIGEVQGGASMIGLVQGGGASLIGEVQGAAASAIGDVDSSFAYSNVHGAEEMYGGADGGADGDIPAPRFRSTKTLNDAVRQFDYKFRVAQIRSNLARSGAELSHYGEKYEKITANSLAEILKSEQTKYANLAKTHKSEEVTLTNNVNAAAAGAAKVAAEKTLAEHVAARKFLDAQWESKKKFWATVEALDGYMRAFTNGIVNHPNDIKDIKAVLDDIEVIRDWYTEASGNMLASVFDHFPSTPAAGAAAPVYPSDKYTGETSGDHYYKVVESALAANPADLPGDPDQIAVPPKGLEARERLKKMLSTMTALKNLLSVFVHFGGKFGGENLSAKTFLTPAQIYNNLVDYLQASAFAQGHGVGDLTTLDANGLVTSYTALPVGASRKWGVWMRSIGDANVGDPKKCFNFVLEDEYFGLIMKSIGAKILTVTGMYDVLDRPHEYNGIRPIRMIMGGDAETPKVDEGAVALYLRLPLLCQFWREIFNFDEPTSRPDGVNRFSPYGAELPGYGDKALKISMLPDIDGTFAGLIRLLFRKNKYLDTSAYSDDDIKEIVRECNSIYQKMVGKHPQNTVMETIYELVAEVNRRYGIVSREDRDKYLTEFGYRYDYNASNSTGVVLDRYERDQETAEIAILPGEEDEEIQRPSAAERLLEGTNWDRSTQSQTASKYGVDPNHRVMVNRFRCVIDKFFENPSEEYSFNSAIKSTQAKLRRETRDEERFKIVSSLVRGVDVYSKVDGIKYLLFHETVVSGLNVLSGLHTMLAKFQARAQLLNFSWLVDCTVKYAATMGIVGLNSAGLATELANEFRATKAAMDDAELVAWINSYLGNDEAQNCNSGRNGAAFSIRPTADCQIADVVRFNGTTTPGGVFTGGTDLASVLNGITIDAIQTLLQSRNRADVDDRNKVLCFFRYLINREFAMTELIESLFGLSSDLQGLVSVKIDDGKLYINAGGLKGLVNELFDQVGYFIDLMRPHIRDSIMAKYTSKLHVGSYYWLQEQLLEKILIGRPEQMAPAGSGARGYANLDEQMKGLSETYQWLTQQYDFDGSGLSSTAASRVAGNPSRNSFDKVFARLVFYDGERPGSGLLPSTEAPGLATGVANSPPKLVEFATDPYEALHLSTAPAPAMQVLDTRFAARFYQLYSWKNDLTLNRSILFVFNQLVAKYIQSFYDPASKKMYKGLIDQFANGTFNRSIVDQRFTYPDVAPMVAAKYSGPEDVKTPPVFNLTDPGTRLFIAALKGVIGLAASPKDVLISPNFATNALANANFARAVAAHTNAADFTVANINAFIREFPYRADINGNSAAERENRIDLFVKGLLQAVELNAVNANWARSVATVISGLKAGTVYSTGRGSVARYLVPAVEMAAANTSKISDASLSTPTIEENTVMFARSEQIKNGPLSGTINGLGIPAPAGVASSLASQTAFGNRADPDSEHVLYTSLSVVIKNLISNRSNPALPLNHIADNIADIPLYMKEKMRANLPAFKNLFRELINRCEFLSKFMNRREMNIDRYWVARPTHNPWPWVLLDPNTAQDSSSAKSRFTGILDTVVRGCQTLITAAETVLREVGDDPKYLETYSGSIRDYRAQYNVDPLMPVSNILSVMQNVTPSTELDFFPVHSLGELRFKTMYGTRSLLQNMAATPTAEGVPGWTQSVESFNLMVETRLQADRSRTDGFLKSLTKGVRYLYDLKRIKGLITPHLGWDCNPIGPQLYNGGMFTRGDLISGGLTQITNKSDKSLVAVDGEHKHTKPVFALRKDLARLVMLTESSSKDDQLRELVDYISGGNKARPANTLAVQNIIDLNIIPINVHALMREIPLANLYNYAYTYDRMIIELFYGATGDAAKNMIGDLCRSTTNMFGTPINPANDFSHVNSAKDMMVAMLLNPYLETTNVVDENSVNVRRMIEGMLTGATGEDGLSRPKFLSDQIFNKAIFGELYSSGMQLNAVGPGVGRGGMRPTYAQVLLGLAKAINDVSNQMTGVAINMNLCGELAGLLADDQQANIGSLVNTLAGTANKDLNATIAKAVSVAFFWHLGRRVRGETVGNEGLQLINLVHTLAFTPQTGTTYSADFSNGSTIPRSNGIGGAVDHFRDAVRKHVYASNARTINVFTGTLNGANISIMSATQPAVTTTTQNTQPGYFSRAASDTTLHYLEGGNLKAVGMAIPSVDVLQDTGEHRFDTVLIRNLILVVNLYRTVRMRLQQDLVYSRDVVLKSAPITREQLTEFRGNSGLSSRERYSGPGKYDQ